MKKLAACLAAALLAASSVAYAQEEDVKKWAKVGEVAGATGEVCSHFTVGKLEGFCDGLGYVGVASDGAKGSLSQSFLATVVEAGIEEAAGAAGFLGGFVVCPGKYKLKCAAGFEQGGQLLAQALMADDTELDPATVFNPLPDTAPAKKQKVAASTPAVVTVEAGLPLDLPQAVQNLGTWAFETTSDGPRIFTTSTTGPFQELSLYCNPDGSRYFKFGSTVNYDIALLDPASDDGFEVSLSRNSIDREDYVQNFTDYFLGYFDGSNPTAELNKANGYPWSLLDVGVPSSTVYSTFDLQGFPEALAALNSADCSEVAAPSVVAAAAPAGATGLFDRDPLEVLRSLVPAQFECRGRDSNIRPECFGSSGGSSMTVFYEGRNGGQRFFRVEMQVNVTNPGAAGYFYQALYGAGQALGLSAEKVDECRDMAVKAEFRFINWKADGLAYECGGMGLYSNQKVRIVVGEDDSF